MPAFSDGRLWTLITGAFFAVTPLCYVAVIGSVALLAGFAKRRIGTYRTVLACVFGPLVGVLGAAALLAVADTRWSSAVDVGFSAGAMAAAAIATAALARPWQDVRAARNRAAKGGHRAPDDHPRRRLPVGYRPGPRGLRRLGPRQTHARARLHPRRRRRGHGPRVRVGVAIDSEGVVHGVHLWLPVLDAPGSLAAGPWT